jgi:enamine deaminase RidA (YjgF/YER057c/UK114 family)
VLFSAKLLKLWSGAWFPIRDESGTEATMSKAYFNPDDLFPSQQYGFSQVIAANGKTTVYLSGQVAWNAEQKIVQPLDLGAQTRRALENLETGVKAAGGTRTDVVSLRVYIVGEHIHNTGPVREALLSFFPPDKLPTSTWIGVPALASRDFLIEIEAVAVLK